MKYYWTLLTDSQDVEYFGERLELNPISRKKYKILNLTTNFPLLTEWWRTQSKLLA